MKTREQLKPNYGPVYAAAMYPGLAEVCHKHGYALAVHGSLARDFDLIAIPWVKCPSNKMTVIQAMTKEYAITLIGGREEKLHGRVAYTLACGFGNCVIDISFMPEKL